MARIWGAKGFSVGGDEPDIFKQWSQFAPPLSGILTERQEWWSTEKSQAGLSQVDRQEDAALPVVFSCLSCGRSEWKTRLPLNLRASGVAGLRLLQLACRGLGLSTRSQRPLSYCLCDTIVLSKPLAW